MRMTTSWQRSKLGSEGSRRKWGSGTGFKWQEEWKPCRWRNWIGSLQPVNGRPERALWTSRFDSMDRASLIKLWKEDLETFAGRSSDELEFYAVHGHWPEQSEKRK